MQLKEDVQLKEWDGVLEATHDHSGWGKLFLGFASILLLVLAYEYAAGRRDTERAIGLPAGVATCGIYGRHVVRSQPIHL